MLNYNLKYELNGKIIKLLYRISKHNVFILHLNYTTKLLKCV